MVCVALLAGSLSPCLDTMHLGVVHIVHLLLVPGDHGHGDGARCEKFGKIGFFSFKLFFH